MSAWDTIFKVQNWQAASYLIGLLFIACIPFVLVWAFVVDRWPGALAGLVRRAARFYARVFSRLR